MRLDTSRWFQRFLELGRRDTGPREHVSNKDFSSGIEALGEWTFISMALCPTVSNTPPRLRTSHAKVHELVRRTRRDVRASLAFHWSKGVTLEDRVAYVDSARCPVVSMAVGRSVRRRAGHISGE